MDIDEDNDIFGGRHVRPARLEDFLDQPIGFRRDQPFVFHDHPIAFPDRPDRRVREPEQITTRIDTLRNIGNTFKKSEELAIIQNIDSDSAKENVLAGGDNVKTEPIVKQEQIDVLADDGFGYPVSNKDKILRLLILGSREPIYNATEKKITIDDMTDIIAMINNGDACDILSEILLISVENRNFRNDALIAVLGLCARYRVHDLVRKDEALKLLRKSIKRKVNGASVSSTVKPEEEMFVYPPNYSGYIKEMHEIAFDVMQHICKTPPQLFLFIHFCKYFSQVTALNPELTSSGYGRTMRINIATWYHSKSLTDLAIVLARYRNKYNGFTNRDVFRLTHPVPSDHASGRLHSLESEQLYYFAVRGFLKTRKCNLSPAENLFERERLIALGEEVIENERNSEALNFMDAYLSLKATTPLDEVVAKIVQFKLVREDIPVEHLGSLAVWIALLEHTSYLDIIKNIEKLASIGVFSSDYKTTIIERLTDDHHIQDSKIHPILLLVAKRIYCHGRTLNGLTNWTIEPEVVQALERAFELSFQNVTITGKKYLLALDISDNMSSSMVHPLMSCRDAAAAMVYVMLKTEEHVTVCIYSSGLQELNVSKDSTLEEVIAATTNCAAGEVNYTLPKTWAKDKEKKFDVFIAVTDDVRAQGETKAFKSLSQYRKWKENKDTKLIVWAMTSSGFTVADPFDGGMLDIAGFDSNVPTIISEFVTDKI